MKIKEMFGFHRFASVSVLRVHQASGLGLQACSHTLTLRYSSLVLSSLLAAGAYLLCQCTYFRTAYRELISPNGRLGFYDKDQSSRTGQRDVTVENLS